MLLTQEVREGINLVQLHLDPERKVDPFSGLPRVNIVRSLPGQPPRSEKAKLRWTGADTLGIEVPLDSGEVTVTTVEVPEQGATALPPVCMPYSPEFRPARGTSPPTRATFCGARKWFRLPGRARRAAADRHRYFRSTSKRTSR